MIQSFRSSETERLFHYERVKKFEAIARPALRKLEVLNAVNELSELANVPGNRLERLSGSRAGQHSIRINDQWRICFVWRNGDAYAVEIVDYH